MGLHLSARVHALVHGLFRSSDAAEVEALHLHVTGQFAELNMATPEGRANLTAILTKAVVERLDIPLSLIHI